ncbi:hypothetical protein K488DRAFT_37318, partial [Vararia minispora EC-137]
ASVGSEGGMMGGAQGALGGQPGVGGQPSIGSGMQGALGGMRGDVGVQSNIGGMGSNIGGMSGAIGGMSNAIGGMSNTIGGMSNTIGGMSNTIGGISNALGGISNALGTVGPNIGGMPNISGSLPSSVGSTMAIGSVGSNMAAVGGITPVVGSLAPMRPPAARAVSQAPPESPVAPKLLPPDAGPPPKPAPAPAAPSGPSVNGSTLDKATTRVSYVAPDALVPLGEDEVKAVQGWMAADRAYDARFRGMRGRMAEEVGEAGRRTRGWWEEPGRDVVPGRQREKWRICFPREREERASRKKGRKGFVLRKKVDGKELERQEVLVPVRLEFDVDHHKMRDTFVWNLNDPFVTPEAFAQTVVDDYQLSVNYVAVIAKQVQEQLSDYQAHTLEEDEVRFGDGNEMVTRGRLDAEEERWWDSWRAKVWAPRKRRRLDNDPELVPVSANQLDFADDDAPEEMRIVIKVRAFPPAAVVVVGGREEVLTARQLDITAGSMKLDDQFEWDIDNPHASPEQFAEVYATDLGLAGEFKTAIAHSIREQVHTYQKSLFLVGHPSDGTAVEDAELRMSFLPSLAGATRPLDQVQSFTPMLSYLSDSEIERNDKERDKEMARRKKRNTRGRRGVGLPDREPIKTARTPALGFPDVDPAVLASAQAANAGPGRRAAAQAAQRTIADMVASENGTAVSTPTLPAATLPHLQQQQQQQQAQQQQQSSAKQDKPSRGHFKPPAFPAEALPARARVQMPTPTTAADASTLPPPLEDDPPLPMAATPPESRSGAQHHVRPPYMSARRAKELEREAKEKEFADGQHQNWIDGVWHCSNCGCPEDIAIGRRKGPLGDKSQCGTCGKFWHRHRRPRPVTYNTDPAHHLQAKVEAEKAKTVSKRKRGNANANKDDDAPTPSTPSAKRQRAGSVASTSSSASEPPLARRMGKAQQANGHAHAKERSAEKEPENEMEEKEKALESEPALTPKPGVPAVVVDDAAGADAGVGSDATDEQPAEWLVKAMESMCGEYPDDRFEITSRPGKGGVKEWRVKCHDCPGKVYHPNKEGEQSMSNFEVHLKNRAHRKNVNDRIASGANAA